jgi:hypothetical protein
MPWKVSVAVVLILAGCAGPAYEQARETNAVLPRALGIGATATSCFFLCFVSTSFEQGDVKEHDAEESELRSKGKTKGLQP